MSRNANVVILCEDQQQEVFVRRFLARMQYGNRDLKVFKAPKGRGSGEQFVRERFAEELAFFRSRAIRTRQALIVFIDADRSDASSRVAEVEGACKDAGIEKRSLEERVLILVPSRNIETWFAYLDGQDVNETDKYPRLRRPRDCRRHVDRLYEMCQQRELRQPAPSSLEAACDEYRTRLLA